MDNGEVAKAGYLDSKVDESFCRLSLTVEVKANQVLVFSIKAKWVLIDWGDGVWSKLKRAKFEKEGIYNLNIIGEYIEWLNLDECGVTFLELDRCDFLRRLRCQGNKLKELNLRNCPVLTFVDCSRNELEYVQVANREKLKEFKGNNNRLQVVDFSGCGELREVDLCYNEIAIIVTRKCRKLKHILFDGALFETKTYKEAVKDLPGVIINEKGLLTIIEDKRLSSVDISIIGRSSTV